MDVQTLIVLANIQGYLSVPIVLIVLWKFTEKDKAIKLIGLFALTSVIGHILQINIRAFVPRGVNMVSAAMTPIDLVIVLAIYSQAFQSKKLSKVFTITSVIFVIFCIINAFLIQGYQNINSNSYSVESVILSFTSIAYFYSLLKEFPTNKISRFPLFWFNAAILLYNAGSFVLFLLTEYLVNVLNNDLIYYWSFYNILRIIFWLLIIVAVWLDAQSKPNPATAV